MRNKDIFNFKLLLAKIVFYWYFILQWKSRLVWIWRKYAQIKLCLQAKRGGGGGGGVMGVELKRHNDGFVSYKYASFGFSKRLTDGLERCGLYYGLIPTAPIHWRGFIGEQVM